MLRKAPPFFLALVMGLAVAACATTPPPTKFPDLTYAHLPSINMAVSAVQVDSRYRSPMAPPHVEHLLPTSPSKALTQWAQDRLKGVGGNEVVRFVILDASVTETPLPRDTSFKGHFTKEQSERYDASIEAVVEIVDRNGVVRANASARVKRSTTVREDASLNERDKVKFGLVEALMLDFNAEIEKNIRQYLVNWLR